MQFKGTVAALLYVGMVSLVYAQQTPTTFGILHEFQGTDGGNPFAGLVLGGGGQLYGTTVGGGATGNGTVFKVDLNGRETILHSFSGGTDGRSPVGNVVLDSAGNVFGTTFYGGPSDSGTVFKIDSAGVETVLYSFTGGNDGKWPIGLVEDSVGNLYGCTQLGGTSFGGAVYRLDKDGNQTVLHNFTGIFGGPDGAAPQAPLVMDGAGNLYGTTTAGGGFSNCNGSGCGTVFKLDTSGQVSILYAFTGGADGANPDSGVIVDRQGNLYGTTPSGGDLTCRVVLGGCGVVFKIDQSGRQTVLHTFNGGIDGAYPFFANLVRDAAGNLFGTTSLGGNLNCNPPSGCGNVFELGPAGRERVLHLFNGTRATSPYSGLTLDRLGNLYGTTYYSGASAGAGSVYEIRP